MKNNLRKMVLILLLIITNISFSQKAQSFRNGFFTFSTSYLDYDFKEINKNMNTFLGKEYDDGIFLYGGALSATLVPGISVGFQYKYGSKNLSGMQYQQDENNETLSLARNNDFILSYWGMNFQYIKSMNSGMNFFSKVSANFGTMELVMSQKNNSMSFDDMFNSFDYGDKDYLNKSINYESDLYLFEAVGGLRLFLRDGVSLDFSVGYLYGFSKDKGTINYEFDNVYNVPDFEFDHFIYEISLNFGK